MQPFYPLCDCGFVFIYYITSVSDFPGEPDFLAAWQRKWMFFPIFYYNRSINSLRNIPWERVTCCCNS